MPEARVLRQLAEALLFERIATWACTRHRPHGPDEEIVWQLGKSAYSCRGRVGAFGRVRVVAGTVRKLAQRRARSTNWQELLDDVPCSPAVRTAIVEELTNTVRLCRWNAEHLPALRASRRQLGYEQLEGALHEGHPYHPCFKARTGFSLDDHAAYGPEAANGFHLCWLAVRRNALRQTLPGDEAEFLGSALGKSGMSALERARGIAAAPSHDYGVLPVHPWQWRTLAANPAIASALANREVVELELQGPRYRASQSLRTLLPVDARCTPHVKLPLSVRITSSLRTLQPETVRAAPAISAWLEQLVHRDPFFEQVAPLVVLREYASALYAPRTSTTAVDGHLAAIWREPVGAHVQSGEAAVPFNALFAVEHDGRPFIDRWVEEHGLVNWLSRLLHASVLPLWRLLTAHGIALEAHAQNLVLLHRGGLPERVAIRDFHDSLEYVPGFLAEPELLPDLAAADERFRGAPPGRYYAMSHVSELRQLFIDTLFVFNLCELSWLLERHYAFPESEFWHRTRALLTTYDRSTWQQPARAARLRRGAPFVPTESLFTNRLRPAGASGFNHLVPNALHEATEGEALARHQ